MQPQPQTYRQTGFSGIDWKDPNLKLHSTEDGPLLAIQRGKLIMEDGRELPTDIELLERHRIPLSTELKKDIIRLNVEKKMASERHEFNARMKQMQAEQEHMFLRQEREFAAAEAQKFTLPDLPQGSGLPVGEGGSIPFVPQGYAT